MSSERNDPDLRFSAGFKDLRCRVGEGVGACFEQKWFACIYGVLWLVSRDCIFDCHIWDALQKASRIGIYSAPLERIKVFISARRV